ncbi:MAG TPA: hypothetical protein VNA89_12420 [Gemmatimonadaceae bacterium]|nr:hypothetical protein [Gemmatimonadaceae bacterium]
MRSSTPLSRALAVTLVALAGPLAAQTAPAQTTPAQPVTSPEAEAIKKLQWRPLGPANNAGRISAVAGVPGDPYTYYVGGAAGGIIKTTNGGTTFQPIFDDQGSASIGAIALAPSDPDIIYVGTGEGNPRNSASIGDGVYKSVDAGRTWTKVGLERTDKVARIVIDPRDPDVVYVCALGREWGPGEERGVFKTIDGGKSWKKVLYKNPTTGCSDLDIDPTNSSTVYAGMYTHLRRAWHFTSGGGETALYKSTDGGATWTKLANGLPKGPMDRIGVAVARSNPDVVYMITEAKDEGSLYRSDDAGQTWRMVNKDPNINFRPFYYSDVRVDPLNPNRIFSLSGPLLLSEDGGKNFTRIARDVHGDHQAMWIDPTDPRRILEGSDGGWQVSFDGGKTFEVVNTFAFTQFYHVDFDLGKPYQVCGGLQDNGNWCGPSQTTSPQGNRKGDWYTVSGGDGFFTVPDLENPHLVYSVSQGGNITLTDVRTGSARSIHPYPYRVGSAGDGIANHPYRYNWNPPIVLDPKDPKTVYFGGNVVFRTNNYGQSWEVISPDLTTNDKAKQQSSGGEVVVDNTAAEFHSTILSIAPSPVDRNVIWVGTDDGNVQLTRDGGKTWTNVVRNAPGLAANAWIATVEASPSDAGTAYFAASRHQDNDYAPYLYKTTDYGKSWRRITTGLPAVGWAHVIREDPRNPSVLYAGTELGVFASWDGGGRWASIRNGLPPVPVRDLKVHPRDNDLVIATHGRGMYVLDDLTPLQKVGETARADVALFDLRPATRYSMWARDGNLGQKSWAAKNPPAGALISYWLRTEPKDSVRITVSDASGKVIRTLRRAPKAAGMNRTNWDLRYDAPVRAGQSAQARQQAAQQAGQQPAERSGEDEEESQWRFVAGPYVLPGEYTVTLSAGGKTLTKTVRVELDPRARVTPEELVAQRDAALQLRDLSTRVAMVTDRTNDLIKQLDGLAEQLRVPLIPLSTNGKPNDAKPGDGKPDAVLAEVTAARDKLKAFRDEQLARPLAGLGYRQYPRLAEEIQTLYGAVSRALNAPTDPQVRRVAELKTETDKAATTLEGIVGTSVARVNELMRATPRILAGGIVF